MRRFYKILDTARNAGIALSFGFIMCVGAAQIFLRHIPGMTVWSWADEIMRYLNIWVIFLAASIGVKESAHLSMDFFTQKVLSPKAQAALKTATSVVNIAVLGLLIYFGFQRVQANWSAMIQTLPISVSWFYLAIPVGSILMAFDYALILIHGAHPYSRSALSARGETAW